MYYQVADVIVRQVEMSQVEAKVQILDLLHSVVLKKQAFQFRQVSEKIYCKKHAF